MTTEHDSTIRDAINERPGQLQLTAARGGQTLRQAVDIAMSGYFHQLDGEDVANVYDMVLAEVEAPLLSRVLEYTRGNQTRAAEVLGLNRGTLRKKLKQYKLI